jgi:hypothetical protein
MRGQTRCSPAGGMWGRRSGGSVCDACLQIRAFFVRIITSWFSIGCGQKLKSCDASWRGCGERCVTVGLRTCAPLLYGSVRRSFGRLGGVRRRSAKQSQIPFSDTPGGWFPRIRVSRRMRSPPFRGLRDGRSNNSRWALSGRAWRRYTAGHHPTGRSIGQPGPAWGNSKSLLAQNRCPANWTHHAGRAR